MIRVQRMGSICLLFAWLGCGREHGADVVGDQCLPDSIPSLPGGDRGFFSSESYVQKDSADCGGHSCVVDRLTSTSVSDGGALADPSKLCEGDDPKPGCVTRAALERSIHCSCQCGGPGSRDKYCTCPRGFLCRELLPLREDGLHDGPVSYCMRPR